MKSVSRFILFGSILLVALAMSRPLEAAGSTATPPEMVAAYETLADTILGAKHTENNLVRAILAATYQHAEATLGRAQAKMGSGQPAREDLEAVAALVSQLGNEGDASVAAVRKRLLEGGHHHHASGEQQGIYDEGFVVVTRAARKIFLDAATALGKMASSTDAAAVRAAWQPVATQYAALTTKGH